MADKALCPTCGVYLSVIERTGLCPNCDTEKNPLLLMYQSDEQVEHWLELVNFIIHNGVYDLVEVKDMCETVLKWSE